MASVNNECFTISEFCTAHRLSRAKFYELLRDDLAPQVLRIGRHVVISRKAATDWRRRMERLTRERSGLSRHRLAVTETIAAR